MKVIRKVDVQEIKYIVAATSKLHYSSSHFAMSEHQLETFLLPEESVEFSSSFLRQVGDAHAAEGLAH